MQNTSMDGFKCSVAHHAKKRSSMSLQCHVAILIWSCAIRTSQSYDQNMLPELAFWQCSPKYSVTKWWGEGMSGMTRVITGKSGEEELGMEKKWEG